MNLPHLHRTTLLVTSALLGSILVSATVTAIRGVPAPKIQDEFSYLLAADTFAEGRVTNPTHPMWQHFESIHIIHQPSYTSKYPPLQSLVLAVGQTIWHPIVGVWLGTGIAAAALVWMLIAWLPDRWHLGAWLLAVLHPGLQTYWGQSYWGGAMALAGASLLLGSYARWRSEPSTKYSLLAGFGILMLANSRPFEGAVLTLAVAAALLLESAFNSANSRWLAASSMGRLLLPASSVLLLGAVAMASYNQCVTGSPWKLPYQVHEENYAWNPVFLWQTAGDPPSYRHADIRNFFAFDKQTTEQAYPNLSAAVGIKSRVLVGLFDFFCGPLILLFPLAVLVRPGWLRDKQLWLVLSLLTPVLLASIASKWANFHYTAPAAPLMILLAWLAADTLWDHYQNQSRMRRVGAWCLIAFQLVWAFAVLGETGRQDADNWGDQRVAMIDQLSQDEVLDLVLVRYAEDHHQHHEWIEWVYNRANIDAAEVVWAREMDPPQRQQLLDYFSDRRVWVLYADQQPLQLQPWQNDCLPEPLTPTDRLGITPTTFQPPLETDETD